MKKEIIQENKARWEVFEWMGSTQSKVIWAVAAAIVVLGIVYLIQLASSLSFAPEGRKHAGAKSVRKTELASC